ncbi:hypothetical protein PC129_g1191 [Phytophthora cactorum]|uniref:C2 domain-containing protein n=1 Tax=Phytophthora cactorum TaxID=29920 RepID=A0A329SQN9_9STRA|nr:hypothetical protein Pcac1_g20783 [Phytophthora cactorum]KAG2843563.1 hypothetical protein PC112_g2604 [Phytophthora cactorum]KAG2845029.1 hypothetical protein PC111_g1754 [Phytophthora cactorum]KAG2866762.1 hypothetical protein PC113_g2572 [Phytophthora cactorum]KAG2929545.1 hypothetical protein PC114_g2782 [Phytophthora cactorum]
MDDHSDIEMPREEEADEIESVTYSETAMESPLSITIPPTDDGALSASYSEAYEDDDQVSSNGSTTPSLSIPASVGSSLMITSRSLGSRSSFGDFPSNSSSFSLSSDQELINLACISLRQSRIEIQALNLSTNTRKPRRPLKSLKALSELTNLVQLDLSGNAIERLDGLQALTHLQRLALPRNHLKTLSAPLFALKGLTHLDLSGNFIAHLPRAFSSLTMLEALNLSGNNLGTLREVDVLAPLVNLLSCSLAANPFCRLPTYKDYIICKIRSLERLDDVEISRVARDRAAKRFGNAIFSQDACLREADRAHEDEQNRLLEAQSALEAENLRLKGELQVKSKLLQNKSRAWSSATEQLLQLQQEVAMLNLDRRRSISPPKGELSDAEQIAMAIAARHKINYSSQRPQSAPRISSPERSVEKRRGSFSERDKQLSLSQEVEDTEECTVESRDAACMPMSPGVREVLKRSKSKMFVDASCSPLRVIPPAILIKEQYEENVDTGSVDDEDEGEEERQEESEDISSPPQTPLTRPTTPLTTRQQRKSAQSLDQVRNALLKMNPNVDSAPRRARPTSTSLEFNLKEDESSGINDLNGSRSACFPTFEDDTACPAYEDIHSPALHVRSSSSSALSSRGRNLSIQTAPNTYSYGSHSLPPSPAKSPSKIREWYRKQNELRLMTPPPSPPRKNTSPQYKPRRPAVEASPLAPFVDKDVLTRQIQALQSCKQSLLTELRNEEHLLHVLKQESVQYADQIDCLSVNIQACLDGDPSAIRFSFSPPGSPRSKSRKIREESTGRARLEILRNKLRFAEDKEKEIETTMVRMTKRVLQSDLNPGEGKDSIHEKFSPVGSSRISEVPFDKEIFALTHKLQLVIVEKEEIHMQMSQLMAQLRGQTTAELTLDDDDGVEGRGSFKQAQSLAKSRQMVDELRTRHREVTDRIQLKERRISTLLEELKEVEAELKHISSLNESSALSPLFQHERTANLEFLRAMRSQRGSKESTRDLQATNTVSLTGNTAKDSVETQSTSSSTGDQIASPMNAPTDQGTQGLLTSDLHFKELLNPEMLEEIKADIYEKLSQKLAERSVDEISANGGSTDLHQAIAAALETRLHGGINTSQSTQGGNFQADYQLECSQQNCVQDGEISTNEAAVDTPADEVSCDDFDAFAPVDFYYARKYVMAKDRVSTFLDSSSNDASLADVTSAQRILKICERLETAEAKSKFDAVSKIEVDRHGNSRGSLKIVLQAGRDLPTAHLRTKNLDPYVCLEVIYPSHALSPSLSINAMVGRVLRSQTKKKSIYPVWDEDFEIAPILSLNGYLHVRVLNDRRLSREQLVGEARIPLHTLLHQKRIVEWFSLGLNVPPASNGSAPPGSIVSKLCGGAVRLQLQLYFSSVERYKHVVDELVTRYLQDHDQLPPFIDAVEECENGSEQVFPDEQPEQNGIDSPLMADNGTESIVFDQRRQMDVESHFPLDELSTSLPSPPRQSVTVSKPSDQSTTNSRVGDSYSLTQRPSIQLSPERRKSLWETKTSAVSDRPATVATVDDKKPYFGFSTATTERKKHPSAPLSMSSGASRRSQTPAAQSKRIKNGGGLQHTSLRRRSVETPECFDKYSPYHPAFKSTDLLDGCNNELGGMKNGCITARNADVNRKTDLSIFKSPSLTRRPPSSGFPERYIGLDNQTCERLKRIFGRMDGTPSS